jgi:hypothetical protein
VTAAERVAAALRDVADLIAATGVADLEIHPWIRQGRVHIGLTVGRYGIAERSEFDVIAAHIGATLTAGHSRGEFWFVHTANEPTLPSGARVSVSTRLRGRPLDLAPLPERRRRSSAAATP